MSITESFEKRLLPHFNSTVYGKDETEELLEHARSLEAQNEELKAMLRKHEHCVSWGHVTVCMECSAIEGHSPDCALAKLIGE